MADIDPRGPDRELEKSAAELLSPSVGAPSATIHDWTPELRARLATLRLSATREAAIIEELGQHLDERRRELVAGGVAPDAATRITLGELERANLLAPRLAPLRRIRKVPSLPPGVLSRRRFGGFWQDFRYAVRTLRHQPVMTLVAILTLAFGIGLNTSMFSFVNVFLFRPLPFPDATQLTHVYRTTVQDQRGGFSPADFLTLTEEAAAVGRFAGYRSSGQTLEEPGLSTQWLQVSADLFDILGVTVMRGRLLRASDQVPGNHRVAVISHGLWQSRFGRADDVVGTTVRTNGEVYEIVGVLPPAATDHRLFGGVGLFSPLTVGDDQRSARGPHDIGVLGRRNASTSVAEAEAFVASLGARLLARFPNENAQTRWRSEPLPDSNTGPTGRAILAMLLGLSACVLLIACSNLANLLIARTIERSREFAVRVALGASGLQLMRTIALEALVLAILGGAAGLIVAEWTTGWMQSVIVTAGGPAFEFATDWRVLSFALGVSMLTLAFCGIVPALFISRLRAYDALKQGGRGAGAAGSYWRARNALIVAQIALSMMLLAGAGFFVRGASNLMTARLGWIVEDVVQGHVALPAARYRDDQIADFYARLTGAVGAVPGVAAASVSYGLPYLGLRGFNRYVAEAGASGAHGPALSTSINGVTAQYFDVTGTRVIAGRAFADQDTVSSPRVAIVNDTMARALFPNANPLGRRVASASDERREWMEIVGVVEDVRSADVADAPAIFQLYQPVAQDPLRDAVLAVRLAGVTAPAAMPKIRAAVEALDPNLSLRDLMPSIASVEQITSQMALVQLLLTMFAGLGLLLAALGLYGSMARMVAQRTGEFGIRMALGARVTNVMGLVFGSGARLLVAGAIPGLLGAIGLDRVLASVLPTMQTNGLPVGVAAMGVLAAMGLIACFVPAHRATKADPLVALRSE